MRSTHLGLAAGVLLAAAAPGRLALAMGGGGGMGAGAASVPSISAPQYNAAEEYQRGMADFQAGKYKDAVRDFEHVTEAQSRAAAGWYMLGMARNAAGDVKGASHAYERSVKIDPKPIAPRRDWAVSLVKLNQKDKADRQLAGLKSQAAACNDSCPEAADLKAAVAAVEAAMSPVRPTAEASPGASLLFSPGAGDVAYVRAVSLINEHRWGDALASLDKAELAFGPHPDILTYKGYVWRKLGKLDKAEAYYKAALAAAPDHRGASEYYGELKVILGDMAGARRMLAKLDAECAFGCAEAEDLRRWVAVGHDPAS
ncbi:MAG: tetratricopeptide repeat protein [Caulobacteraceae bacterium]